MNDTRTTAAPSVPLESVLCTEELNGRPSRPPNYETENRAMISLAQALADSPSTILQAMAEKMLEVFQCDSAGFSLLTHDEKRFVWAAIAGAWQPHQGGGTPRDFGPCGDVLDCNAPLLFRHAERRYPHLLAATPAAEEGLLVPFYVAGRAVGTIWAIAHDERRKFDSEDLRMLVSLGTFASAAYQAVEQVRSLADAQARQQTDKSLRDINEALLVSSVRQHELAEQSQQAEASVRASEERYRALFDLGPVAVYSCDASGTIREFNRRAAELWGREPALGDTDERFCGSFRLFRPDGSFMPHDQCPMAEVLSGKIAETRDAEVLVERPDGSRITVVVNIRSLKDGRGEITGAINCFYDITERKMSEQKFRGLLESAPDAMVIIDEEGRIALINAQTEKLFGYARGELVGQPVELLIPQRFHDCHPGRRHLFFGDPKLRPMGAGRELRAARKDGTEFPVEISLSPLETEAGVLVTAAIRDITDRKRTEEQLQQNHDTFYNLIENSPFGIYIVDSQFHMVQVSAAAKNVFRNIHPLIGRDFKEIMSILWPEEFVRSVIGRFRHTLDTGERFAMPNFSERRRDNAHVESYDWKIERITLPDGQFGVVCYFYDITERSRLEKQLQEQAVALAEADRRKNEFLAMLAHELRNPLAPIRNAAQVLRLSEGNGKVVRSASAMVERQVGQMVRLVDDLLDVSRVSRGTIELRRGRIELASSVHHAVEAARPLHESMGHELSVTLPPEPIYLNADPARLTQVVGNLLNNACKFTEKGGRISLAVERQGGEAVIRVRDNGIGIAADQLPRIFGMFVQIDTSLERSVSGLGIGLTLVKSLVEMHDGTVEVSSAGLGRGSEFVVRLPALEAVPVPPPEPPPEPPAGVPPPTGHRILVVDDNRDSAESLADLLNLTGNETLTAHDGVEAVEAAASFRPEVVLLDIGLPKMNGYEAARTIRDQPWGKAMVLVALTGWGQDEDRRKSKEVGFNGHLVKPVDFAVLTRLLAELLPTADRPAGVARIADG